MSADSYAVCPRCRNRLRQNAQSLAQQVITQYGVLPMAEWEALKEHADQAALDASEGLLDTLKEYKTLELCDNGKLFIRYKAVCDEPGCEFKFDYEHIVPVPEGVIDAVHEG